MGQFAANGKLLASSPRSTHTQCNAAIAAPVVTHQLWYVRGKQLLQQGDYEAALACFDVALKLQPNQHRNWIFRGVILTHLQFYESALACFDRALELTPNDRNAWIFRGAVLTYLNRNTEALNSYNQALQIQQPISSDEENYPMWLPSAPDTPL